MKRTAAVLLLAVLSVFLFANAQKYYAVSSEEWRLVQDLCHYAGVAGPSSVGPVTEAQLKVAVDRAVGKLGPDHPFVETVLSSFSDNNVLFADDLGVFRYLGEISPEVYVQTGGKDMDISDTVHKLDFDGVVKPSDTSLDPDRDWFVADAHQRKPLATFALEMEYSDVFYSRFVFNYGEKTFAAAGDEYWTKAFHQNVKGAAPTQNFPYDAGISLGNGPLGLIIARGAMEIGEGYTGNTAVGDNYDYQEFLKAQYFSRHFGVTLSITNFDTSHDTADLSGPDAMYGLLCARFSGFKQLRHSVSYEFLPVDSLRVNLNMINLLDTTSGFDFRYLNPFAVMHNMFNYHQEPYGILEANNMLSLEVSWSPARKWALYGQLSMDQIQTGGEVNAYQDRFGYVDPNGFAFLLDASYTDMVGKGILNVYGEAVVTSPAMYLNQKYYDGEGNVVQKKPGVGEETAYCWSQDWLLGYKRTEQDADDVAFSGYRFGPDAVVAEVGGSFRVPGSWTVEAKALYMAHGEKGTGTNADNYNFHGIDTVETVNKLLPFIDGETVEHTALVAVEGSVYLKPWLRLDSALALSGRWNYRNTPGRTFQNLQFAFGVSINTR